MAVNKVVLGNETLLDLTGDTATAADVAEGKTFHLASGVQATGTASGGGVGVFYGTCATAAATAAKVVTCEDFTSSDLVEGAVINVKFANAQTYNGAPTLNVNSTGAKNVKRVGNTNAARYEWQAGEVLQFVYDGSYWMLTDGGIATTTYYGVTKLSSATNSTSNALAATASAVKAAYDHADGKQDALVSGTSIKTINGESLLGSGDLSVGGGGVSYVTQAVSIPASAWSGTTATVNASAATATNDVIVTPAPESVSAWASAGIYCSAQGGGTLTFACTTAPTEAVTANVMAFEGGETIVPSTYSVTVSLTNPTGASSFSYGEIYLSTDGSTDESGFAPKYAKDELLASFASATDSVTVEVDAASYGIVVLLQGETQPPISASNVTCTGGVSYVGTLTEIDGTGSLFQVTGGGTITIDGVDYSD